MTVEQQIHNIKAWCGKDFPICFDVEVKEVGVLHEFNVEIAGGEENKTENSYAVVNNWDELVALTKDESMEKNDFKIIGIYDYQASHPIIFK